MNQNVNRGGSATKKKGPVWKVKVQIYSVIPEGLTDKKVQLKFWKIKEILN